MPISKYIYRTVKSSWGIYIELVAQSKSVEKEPVEAVKITNRLFFINVVTDIKLSSQELHFIKSGLRWVAPQIEKSSSVERRQLIELKNIILVETDFQVEGLHYAIAGWAANHFDFPMPEYQVYFDKKRNRYEFPELQA